MTSLFQKWDTERFKTIIYNIFRIGLGLIFVYASLDKIWNPGLFAVSISNYKLLPLPLLHITAIILPWLELICGIALIANVKARAANQLIGVMLIVFTLAIIISIFRGLDFNCGCYNQSESTSNIGLGKVLNNLQLILVFVILEIKFRKSEEPDSSETAA